MKFLRKSILTEYIHIIIIWFVSDKDTQHNMLIKNELTKMTEGRKKKMNNLFIRTKAEVRTIQSIRISVTSIKPILLLVQQDHCKDIYWKTSKIDLSKINDMNFTDLKKAFISLWSIGHSKEDIDTIEYIVRVLGFDGVENFGYYSDTTNCIHLVVYNNGDHLN